MRCSPDQRSGCAPPARAYGIAVVVLAPVLLLAFAGCESTQSKSARLAREADASVGKEKGVKVAEQSRDVKIGDTAAVADANGAAAVVEIRNATKRIQAGVPVSIVARDARKKAVFKNDTPGLEPSLVKVPALAPGESILWVNDQLVGEGIRSVTAKSGAGTTKPPKTLPAIGIGKPKLVLDPTSGVAAEGRLVNRSKVEQKDIVVFCVARKGRKVVAAGRSLIEKLRPGKSGSYQVFFIGNPRGAKLTLAAPPTVLE